MRVHQHFGKLPVDPLTVLRDGSADAVMWSIEEPDSPPGDLYLKTTIVCADAQIAAKVTDATKDAWVGHPYPGDKDGFPTISLTVEIGSKMGWIDLSKYPRDQSVGNSKVETILRAIPH